MKHFYEEEPRPGRPDLPEINTADEARFTKRSPLYLLRALAVVLVPWTLLLAAAWALYHYFFGGRT